MASELFIKKQKEKVEAILKDGDASYDNRGYSIHVLGYDVLNIHRPEGVGTLSSAYLGTHYSPSVDVEPETLLFIGELLGEEVV